MGLIVPSAKGPKALFTFAHEFVPQTLLAGFALPRRQRLHLQVADAIERVYAGALHEHAGEMAHHLVKPGSLAYIQRLSTISPSQRNMDPTPPHMKTRCASYSPRCRTRTSSTKGSKRIDGPTGNGGSRHREIGRDLPDWKLQLDSIARYAVPVVAAVFIRVRISCSSASAHNLRQKPRSVLSLVNPGLDRIDCDNVIG
jgi:hypothetical protein